MRAASIFVLCQAVAATLATTETDASWPHLPRYETLPPLREQADIQNGWLKERWENIPSILQKYGVDAWLVRSLASLSLCKDGQGPALSRSRLTMFLLHR